MSGVKHTILFPGGFKPFHDGHYMMLKRAAGSSPSPDEVRLVISSRQRDGITAESTFDFLESIKIERLVPGFCMEVTPDDIPSPVAACYSIANGKDPKEVFAMVDSDKDDMRSSRRSVEFYLSYQKGGRYYKNVVKTYDPRIPRDSLPSDDGGVLSARALRAAVAAGDFDSFARGYGVMLNDGAVTENQVREYFDALRAETAKNHEINIHIEKYKDNGIMQKNIREDAGHPEYIDVALNVTEISKKYGDIDFNALSKSLEDVAEDVNGEITDDGVVVMNVSHVDEDDIEKVLVDDYGIDPADADEYIFGNDEALKECGDFDLEECGDVPTIEESREQGTGRRINERAYIKGREYINLDDIEREYGKAILDDIKDEFEELNGEWIFNDGDSRFTIAIDEPFTSKDAYDALVRAGVRKEDAFYVVFHKEMLDEGVKVSNPKKGKGTGRRINESLKAADPKLQNKVDKSEAELNDIIAKVKGTKGDLDPAVVKEATKKLKKEVSNLKKYGVDPSKISNIKSTIVKLAKTDPSLKEILENGSADIIIAKMMKRSRTLHDDVKLNGKVMSSISTVSLHEALQKVKDEIKDATESLNESATVGGAEKISKLARIAQTIKEEIEYREYMYSRLNEDESENKGDGDAEDAAPVEPAEKTEEPKDDEKNPEEDETVELSSIVFTLKNAKAADDFIASCVDAGIPEDVIVKDEEETREKEDKDTAKVESAKPSAGSKSLNEEGEEEENADEPAEAEEDKENPEDNNETIKDESNSDVAKEDESVKVVLLNTDYVPQVMDILKDVYGIEKEEFEEMIGGEILKDDESDKDEDKKPGEENGDEDEDEEEKITPEDIFKDL